MTLLTPARSTALIGVVTGLAGVATSLTGVVDVHSAVGQGLVAVGGYLTTAVSVGKFLEGQSKWETTQANLDSLAIPAPTAEPETPLATNDTDVPAEVADPNEPPRLAEQVPA